MKTFKRHQKAVVATVGALTLMLHAGEGKAATWQDELQSRFDVVDTFDELQDWTPGGQWYSGAGCETCASNKTLPTKIDGSESIWGLWNNKGLSFEYTPQGENFAAGDVITGATSGATATVRRVWELDGKWYIQLTNTNQGSGSYKFAAGETVTSGTKAGSNLQWPLFIANHGPANTWRGTGKSLVLDLGDNNNTNPLDPTMAGLGAQRMGTYFGDGASGKSGYKKAHAFFMMKVSPSYFNNCSTPGTGCVADGYDPVSVVKVFDLNSGFTGVSQWGTPAERAQVSSNPTSQARLDEYGLNFSVFNFGGGGLSTPQSLFFTENIHVTTGTSGDYTYAKPVAGRKMRSGTTTDIEPYVRGGEWFGVEVAQDMGTAGNRDGSTDLWIYDKTGKEIGHFAVAGENRLMYFDHFYNKFVLGGNRLSSNGKTGSLDSRWWIDDVIIHGSRIGTTYFQMLSGLGVADTTAPAAAITAPTSGATASGVASVSVNATDDVGVTKVEFYVNGALKDSGTAGPFNWDTRALANGTYNLTTKAHDAAGNIGASATVPVSVYNAPPDTTAPVVSIASPTGGSSVSDTVTVSIDSSDDVAVSKVELYVNGAIYGVVGTSPYSISWNTSAYSKGNCTLQAKAYDAAGNVGSSSLIPVLIVDITAPVVTAFAMPSTATALDVPLILAATDAVGVTGYLVSENSSTPPASDSYWVTTPPSSFTFAGAGARTAYAWAKDAAGNVSAVASAKVTITIPDTAAPTVTSFTMPATAHSFTVPVTAFTASDNVGVTGYLVTESSTPPAADAAGWSATKTLKLTFKGVGVRTAYAWTKDAAGNVSAGKGATVIVDGTAPVITSIAPAGGTYALNSTVQITATATDAIMFSHIQVSVDSQLKSQTNGGSISYSWKAATVGTHVILIVAYDKVGNKAVKNVSITVK